MNSKEYNPLRNIRTANENELMHLSWDAEEQQNGYLRKRIEQRKNELEKYDY